MQKPITRARRPGTWIWQALSGIGLLVLLTLHMIANHFVREGGLQTYQDVIDYLSNPLIIVLEVAFLAVVTYHALLGVRAIFTDLGLSDQTMTTINRILTVLGVIMVAWGVFLTLYIVRLGA